VYALPMSRDQTITINECCNDSLRHAYGANIY
jgi:hypothetical protein